MQPITRYADYCNQARDTQKYRKLPAAKESSSEVWGDFSTNDYLGLAKHPSLPKIAYESALKYGVGATGSRLLSGNYRNFEELETQIAKDKNTETALIFNSGYQANISVLEALCHKNVLKSQALIFFDKLNHASLYQGAFLSGAELVRYKHGNMVELERLLEKYKTDSRPKFIVAETLFGMDGDVVDLEKISTLAKFYNALLYLDEAHATGILGPQGYGLSTTINLTDISCVIMGTFSKAVGACGAYIACSNEIKEYLINKCSGFIYSTALSPMLIEVIKHSWQLISESSQEREQVLHKGEALRACLKAKGFNTGNSSTHIIPVILGEEAKVLHAKNTLSAKNIIVSAIRPPTVPPGTSRLRIALSAMHTQAEIDHLVDCLGTI